MIRALHLIGTLLLPVCGWLAGSAVQIRTEQHIAQLQRTAELLRQIRQEILYRRPDMKTLRQSLARQELLGAPAAERLQDLAAPAAFTAREKRCFEQCFSGLGQSEAAQEAERLQYYIARFEEFLHLAKQEAAARAGLPCRLGLAAGAVLALILL